MNTYLISDLHLGHDKPFIYERRGFKSCEEHDQHVRKTWNHYICDCDIVYVLGDIGMSVQFSYLKNIFKNLKGNKILIQGNHDKMTDSKYRELGFQAIFQEVKLRIGKHKYIKLAHCPYEGTEDGYRFKPYLGHRPIKEEGVWLGHGHVHHLWKVKEQMINVSYDIWKRPVHLHRDIRSIINKEEK